ncbi:MAG: deoxyhypusine synthase family protein [Candidatus Omnitrophota bacterium]|nr:deoxyhypusine synthase family protein [Candidatus Omnitrophota bacterium]
MAIDLTKVKTYSLKKRKSKVGLQNFAAIGKKNAYFRKFYDGLPDILAARNFKQVVDSIISARKKKKAVIFMMGAHVIKCGLSPIVIDLIKKKIITSVALNGAGIIHDFELSYSGSTSEDVACGLENGSFGMSKETAEFLNMALTEGSLNGWGAGEAVARRIANKNLNLKHNSILYNCFKAGIPVTVHIAVGADIIHQHPLADGASIGRASLLDFRTLAEEVTKLDNGGVIVNVGSAVMLPEVFLKALNLARNLGHRVTNFTAVAFDMIHQYRVHQNVVCRPSLGPRAKGYYIVGHHELMIPLLYQAILEKL